MSNIGDLFLHLKASGCSDENIAQALNIFVAAQKLSPVSSSASKKGKKPVVDAAALVKHDQPPDGNLFKKGKHYDIICVNQQSADHPALWLWEPASDSRGLEICARISSLALRYYGDHFLEDFRTVPKKVFHALVTELREEYPNSQDCQFDDDWVRLKLIGIMKNKRYKWRKKARAGLRKPEECPSKIWKRLLKKQAKEPDAFKHQRANRMKGKCSSRLGRGGLQSLVTKFYTVVGRMPTVEDYEFGKIHGISKLYDMIEEREQRKLNRSGKSHGILNVYGLIEEKEQRESTRPTSKAASSTWQYVSEDDDSSKTASDYSCAEETSSNEQ